MSDNMQELRQRILKMEHNVNFLVKTVSALAKNVKPNRWMDESEVMEAIGVKISQMRNLRRAGVLIGYSSTGKNFKYLRTEVEEFIEGKKANEIYTIKENRKKQVHN